MNHVEAFVVGVVVEAEVRRHLVGPDEEPDVGIHAHADDQAGVVEADRLLAELAAELLAHPFDGLLDLGSRHGKREIDSQEARGSNQVISSTHVRFVLWTSEST